VPISSTQLGSITLAVTPVKFSPNLLFLFDVQQKDKTDIIGGERFDIGFIQQKQTTTVAKTASAANTQTLTKNEQLKVYQSGKQLNIQMNDGKEYVVTIANSFGHVLVTTKMINQKVVPVNNYQQGIYFIKLVNAKEQKQETRKYIVQLIIVAHVHPHYFITMLKQYCSLGIFKENVIRRITLTELASYLFINIVTFIFTFPITPIVTYVIF
jgi:hypothetical protein